MRIFCEKCHEDISVKTDNMFENYIVGKVQCDKCQKIQSRYISEADLLLYYGVSEIIYLVISIITNLIIDKVGMSWWMVLVLIVILAIYFIVQKRISKAIYNNAYFKKETMYYDFKENVQDINKSMKWQFVLFFALAITFIMEDKAKLVFGILLILSVGFTFVKFYLAIKKEKEILNKK